MNSLRFLTHPQMHVIQFHFVGRARRLSIDTTEGHSSNIRKYFESETPNDLGFATIETRQGQTVIVNADRLKLVRYLLERESNAILDKSPSVLYREKEVEDYEAIKWDVRIWIEGLDLPISISRLGGHDWITLTTGIEMPDHFIEIRDDDDELLTIRRSSIELVIGFEVSCYPEGTSEILYAEMQEQKNA